MMDIFILLYMMVVVIFLIGTFLLEAMTVMMKKIAVSKDS